MRAWANAPQPFRPMSSRMIPGRNMLAMCERVAENQCRKNILLEVYAMKYIVEVAHYIAGQGYSYTECAESGRTDKLFPASDWNYADEPFVVNDAGWVEIKVEFYADDADPAIDDPIHVDTHTI